MQSTEPSKREELAQRGAQLLAAYRADPNVERRNELVMHYSYIAKTVAAQMRGITSSYAEVEDIVNNGILTLIDCVERYDPEKSERFESYAFHRIKCANIDFIRKQDWLPRRVRKTAREISDAYAAVSNELLREPTAQELAERLGVQTEVVQRHYREISNAVLVSFEAMLADVGDAEMPPDGDDDHQPEGALLQRELRERLREAVLGLGEKERLVVTLYYYEHLKLYEIAQVLKISEARACQIRSRAISKLQQHLQSYVNN